MKRVLLLCLLLLTSFVAGRTSPGIAQELLPEPVIIPATQPKSFPTCIVGGCSGELCVDAEKGPHYSICLWKDEYACLKHAVCELQSGGTCGWTYTDAYNACIGGSKTPQPTPTPGNEPYCRNSICEAGEADDSWCPPCPEGQRVCPIAPCYFKPGTCPSDCSSLPPEPTPASCKDMLCPLGTSLSQTCECRPIVSSGDGTGEANEGSKDLKTGKIGEESPPDTDETDKEEQSGQQNGSQTSQSVSPTLQPESATPTGNISIAQPPQNGSWMYLKNFVRLLEIYLDWFF
ncbi:MAG: hypothetical protein A2785_03300 [Candidatus Chisholmbacteria bacterium RIFCSPHIGHO2_01_FULL_49_18]|uniref:Uncharacterized protein n=1 Tax=Candidatus Chisholmbacteria bacterium RIFCSPHIGHO2_01_FULL_49_18 TaxID=1797590 RepID=A0A1G1VMK5_9BACT|nr:MAG: hypothetical protein A2785_03300 [Candidatus Chisholmbacteria bacterium RIFCSPHIGHO2_01_FULL_49_18]